VKYRYFISYSYIAPSGLPSFGAVPMNLDVPIATFDEIRAIAKVIERSGAKSVVPISWQRFEDPIDPQPAAAQD